ncbi:MAG: hypothetical protein ACRC3A_05340, partial [Culicoidibacterales bacterium]
RLQDLFGKFAEEAAKITQIIVRKREITPMNFLAVHVFSWIKNKNATNETFLDEYENIGITDVFKIFDSRLFKTK